MKFDKKPNPMLYFYATIHKFIHTQAQFHLVKFHVVFMVTKQRLYFRKL